MMLLHAALVVFLGSFLAVNADHDHSEYDESSRSKICAKNNDNLYDDLSLCFKKESPIVQDASSNCSRRTCPELNGETIACFKKGCGDKTVFKTFDNCMKEYEADDRFKEEEDVKQDAIDCYNKAFEKYELPELMLEQES